MSGTPSLAGRSSIVTRPVSDGILHICAIIRPGPTSTNTHESIGYLAARMSTHSAILTARLVCPAQWDDASMSTNPAVYVERNFRLAGVGWNETPSFSMNAASAVATGSVRLEWNAPLVGRSLHDRPDFSTNAVMAARGPEIVIRSCLLMHAISTSVKSGTEAIAVSISSTVLETAAIAPVEVC